jgi:outer membrane protein OmpA-like peptidoglycan-associated protein
LNDLPANLGFLIVGYADDSGVAQANESVSLARAEVVSTRLQELGVSLRRLVAVGRSNENRISQETGPNSANRRVEIELIFLQADID